MEIKKPAPEKPQKDAILIEEAKKGNEKAFARLMNKYKGSIYNILFKMVNNMHDAEDLTMEVFYKAFKNIHTYKSDYAFSTWLFMIATNTCIDFIRKRKTYEDTCIQDKTFNSISIISDSPDPEEEMINKQNANNLKKIIGHLKPEYKNIIELRYFNDYSYKEIADKLNIPIGTVKTQLYRAKTALQKIIIENEND